MYVTCIVPCMCQVQDQAAAREDEATCRKSTSNSGLWTTVMLQEAGLVKLPPLQKNNFVSTIIMTSRAWLALH